MATDTLEKIRLTTLRILIDEEWTSGEDLCEWVVLGEQPRGDQRNALRRGRNTLADLPQCTETEVVISASMLNFIQVTLPVGNRQKVLGALPFLVEDSIISPPEDIHAVIAAQSGNEATVAVIQKECVKRILECLAHAGIQAKRMFPELLLPELQQGSWALVFRGQDGFVRTGLAQGFSLSQADTEDATPPLALRLALSLAIAQTSETASASEFGRPNELFVYGDLPAQAATWQEQLGIPMVRALQQEWLIENITPAFNLLQGEFQPASGIGRKLVAFRPAAIVALCLLTLHFGFSVLDYGVKSRKNRQIEQDMVSLFKASFPQATVVVDAQLQMQRNLDELKHTAGESGNADFLPLLSAVTAKVGAISNDKLLGISYQGGKLTLHLLMPDMAQAQALRQKLTRSGMSAVIENAHPVGQAQELLLIVGMGAV